MLSLVLVLCLASFTMTAAAGGASHKMDSMAGEANFVSIDYTIISMAGIGVGYIVSRMAKTKSKLDVAGHKLKSLH